MTTAAPGRLPDWRARLTRHIALSRIRPFALGSHDCVQFAAGAVLACTGVDPIAGRVRYRTAVGARRALARLGVADHVAFARDRFPPVPPSSARMGDLAAIETEEGPALAVVGGAHLYAVARVGLAVLSLTDARAAFRV